MTKAEWIISEIGFLPVEDDWGIDFYYKAMNGFDMGLCDADDYAYLNTLMQYDIGGENALAIIRWYYEEEDATVNDALNWDQKETLRDLCNNLGIELDFSGWVISEPENYGW